MVQNEVLCDPCWLHASSVAVSFAHVQLGDRYSVPRSSSGHGSAPGTGPCVSPGTHVHVVRQKPHSGFATHSYGSRLAAPTLHSLVSHGLMLAGGGGAYGGGGGSPDPASTSPSASSIVSMLAQVTSTSRAKSTKAAQMREPCTTASCPKFQGTVWRLCVLAILGTRSGRANRLRVDRSGRCRLSLAAPAPCHARNRVFFRSLERSTSRPQRFIISFCGWGKCWDVLLAPTCPRKGCTAGRQRCSLANRRRSRARRRC